MGGGGGTARVVRRPTMSRPSQYEFTDQTKQEAFAREGGKCAWCGDKFTQAELADAKAHHITSVEAAKAQGWTAEQARSVDNCAYVHGGSHYEGEKACHSHLHGHGRFGKIDADRSEFR